MKLKIHIKKKISFKLEIFSYKFEFGSNEEIFQMVLIKTGFMDRNIPKFWSINETN